MGLASACRNILVPFFAAASGALSASRAGFLPALGFGEHGNSNSVAGRTIAVCLLDRVMVE